jgi:hypothetical protein
LRGTPEIMEKGALGRMLVPGYDACTTGFTTSLLMRSRFNIIFNCLAAGSQGIAEISVPLPDCVQIVIKHASEQGDLVRNDAVATAATVVVVGLGAAVFEATAPAFALRRRPRCWLR